MGYILREPVTLPPLTLTAEELQALSLGLQLVTRGADPSLTRAAESLLGKVTAVLPTRLLDGMGEETWVFPGAEALAAARHLPTLRRAIRLRERVVIGYVDGSDQITQRRVRPLQLEFWGRVWTLASWCEDRQDFRSFRVDRIETLTPTKEIVPPEPGRDLAAWRRIHPEPQG